MEFTHSPICQSARGRARWPTLAAAIASILMVLSAAAHADDPKAVLAEAIKAMGASDLSSVVYSGAAAQGNFGQSRTISFRLASTLNRNYTRGVDFTRPASRATGDSLPPVIPGAPPPQPGTYTQMISAATPAWADQMLIWVTPWGFLRGALANNATVRSRRIEGVNYKVVTWSPAQKAPSGQPYRLIGYINPDNLVERVETWVEHPIFGDMPVEIRYSDYKDFNGLKAPAKISQRQVGMETFVAAIASARANPPDLAQLMAPSGQPGRGDAPAPAGGRGG